MYKKHEFGGQAWVHSSDLHPISGNYTKPKYWDLIEEMPRDMDPRVVEGVTKTSGNWRLTLRGKLFVEGKITIQEKAILFNKKCYGYTGKMATISDCLKKPFNYQELWEGTSESLFE